MKKLLVMVIALMATVNMNAQIEEGEWYITPRVGLGIADLTGKLYSTDEAEGSYDATLHPITSFAAGLDFAYAMTDQLSLSLGVFFTTQGAKTKDEHEFKVTMDYFNVPLLLNYYPIPECGLAIKTGVQLGFMSRKKIKYDGQTYDVDFHGVVVTDPNGRKHMEYTQTELSKQFHKFDCSIPIGISYELYNIVLDARYNLGLTNVMKEDAENSKNSVWMFTLGYKFNFGN